MSGQPDEPLELVAIVYRQDELAVIRSRLEAEDIWCFCQNERQVSVDIGLTLALGGARLFVHPDEAEMARVLLADQGGWKRSGGVYDDVRWLDWIMALMLAILAATPPPARIASVLVPCATRRAD